MLYCFGWNYFTSGPVLPWNFACRLNKEISCLLSYAPIYSELFLVYLMQKSALKRQGHFHLDTKWTLILLKKTTSSATPRLTTLQLLFHQTKKNSEIQLSRFDHSVTMKVFTALFQGSLGSKSHNTFPSSFGWWRQEAGEPGRHSCCHRPQLIRGRVSRAATCMACPGAL